MSYYANSSTTAPLAPYEPRRVTTPISHSSEQGTLPTASLISKQGIPYWTCGGTCCLGVSTPMTQSLADSSMTNHITWRILIVSTIPNLAQTTASILTMVTSHHDGWKTSTLNTPQVKVMVPKSATKSWSWLDRRGMLWHPIRSPAQPRIFLWNFLNVSRMPPRFRQDLQSHWQINLERYGDSLAHRL
jgi:hypothetical protein